jgi:hypothetical protein
MPNPLTRKPSIRPAFKSTELAYSFRSGTAALRHAFRQGHGPQLAGPGRWERTAGVDPKLPDANGSFPAGSADTFLVGGLTAAGFKSAGVCKSDSNTKILAYDKNTIPNVVAEVYWQA